jgi:NAD(P)-dependent dehydrogenase (short-subunit alcohol dehydrogenase family)
MTGISGGLRKAAIVFGGSRGIGAAIVRRLAADGADVAFTYVSAPERARETAAAIEAGGRGRWPFMPTARTRRRFGWPPRARPSISDGSTSGWSTPAS